jgi:hypothetical protein
LLELNYASMMASYVEYVDITTEIVEICYSKDSLESREILLKVSRVILKGDAKTKKRAAVWSAFSSSCHR